MSLSLARTVSEFAEPIERTVVRTTIRGLQRMRDDPLSGGDSVLRDVWDEICIQVQEQESVYWGLYVGMIDDLVRAVLRTLSDREQALLWLQSPGGEYWLANVNDQPDLFDPMPVDLGDTVSHLTQQVLNQAADWSNPRIRRHLESFVNFD